MHTLREEIFAGINIQELGLTKDYTGINFRKRNLYKYFEGINFAFTLKKIYYTTLVYGFVKNTTLLSLIVGGQLPNFQFFSADFNLLPPSQFVKILKKSNPPDYCHPPPNLIERKNILF